MSKLDRTDRKLLVVLGRNARLSQQQIGKAIGTSRDVVQYRMKQLEAEGYIKGYIASIANPKFGIDNYVLLLKLQHLNGQMERSIIGRLAAIDYVKILFRCRGDYDVAMVLGAKNKQHLASLVEQISNICSRSLREFDLEIYVRLLKFEDYGFLLPDFTYEPRVSPREPVELDVVGRKIAKLLSRNARMPIVDVAKAIGLSAEQTSVRLKQLLRGGVITGTQAVLNFERLGLFRYLVLLKLNYYSHRKEQSIRELLRQMPRITHAERVLGKWDLRLNVVAETHREFLETLDRIRGFFGRDVSHDAFALILEETKRQPFPGAAE